MTARTHDVVICGAGIAGISAAYYLGRAGIRDVLLVDGGPPLDLTSGRSTECYRNWWPDPAMLALMNRSIDLLEGLADQSGNAFGLNRRGYLYVTGDEGSLPALKAGARRISSLGGGPLRVHEDSSDPPYLPAAAEGYRGAPWGADLLLGASVVHRHFPYLSEDAVAALHVRRAGWLSAQQLGMYLLSEARAGGTKLETAHVSGLEIAAGHLSAVSFSNGEKVLTGSFVNAAGPFLGEVAGLAGIRLPVQTDLHQKAAFKDELGAIPREAPLLIWSDAQALTWSDEERGALSTDPELHWLTGQFPPGVHMRPEGGSASRMVLALWDYNAHRVEPVWPPVLDDGYPEVALRGLVRMVPALGRYLDHMPRPQLDGGYYTRTPENRPLVGPTEVQGYYVNGALSGYGIMSACAAGELLAAHVMQSELPSYAQAFVPTRYEDSAYLEKLEDWGGSGQL